jgi:hypothetical protein
MSSFPAFAGQSAYADRVRAHVSTRGSRPGGPAAADRHSDAHKRARGKNDSGEDQPTGLQLKHETLDATTFGARVAEEEADDLGEYFVETDQWKRVYRGDVDVVYGAKGSRKSAALYSLLVERGTELFDRNIVILAAD